MPLRWVEATVEWKARDHDMWSGYEEDRTVAQVSTEWLEGRWVWAAYYWGDLPPMLGTPLGRDPRQVGGAWESPLEAMAAVDARAMTAPQVTAEAALISAVSGPGPAAALCLSAGPRAACRSTAPGP